MLEKYNPLPAELELCEDSHPENLRDIIDGRLKLIQQRNSGEFNKVIDMLFEEVGPCSLHSFFTGESPRRDYYARLLGVTLDQLTSGEFVPEKELFITD